MPPDDPLPLPNSPKLRRASELFEQAVRETVDFMRAGSAVHETRPAPGAISYEFPPAPEHIRLLLGDCFQSLRSALDHEVYGLAAARHGHLWADGANTAFPLSTTEHIFNSQGRKQIRGLSSAGQAFVAKLQPFLQPQHPIVPLLVFVHDVARVDRHRLLNLAALQPRSIEVHHATGRIGLQVELRFVLSEFSGQDALGAARQAIAATAWTIDGLRAADQAPP